MQSELIKDQIQELYEQQFIENIEQINQNCFQVTYSPHTTNSPYSQQIYNVKVAIPNKYPQVSPHLHFIDKIYHLNINPVNGLVSMPILSDDWSPFLTLSAVFESLNCILEEPDINYPSNETIKDQYINNPEKYANKVNQIATMSRNTSKQNLNHSIVEHVQEISNTKNEGILLCDSAEKIRIEQMQSHLTESISFQHDNKMSHQDAKTEEKVQQVKVQNKVEVLPFGENLKNKDQEQKLTKDKHQEKRFQQSPTFKRIGQQKLQDSSKQKMFLRPTESYQIVKCQQFGQVQQSLRKIDQLIQTMLHGCESLESVMKNSQNDKVKLLLEKKLERQWQMVEQLFELSSKLKEKIFITLKNQTKGLLQ